MNRFACSVAVFIMLVAVAFGPRLAGADTQEPTGVASADVQQSVDVSTHPWIGKAAPGFALKNVGGGKLKLRDLRGKYAVIHFGASW